MGIERQRMLAGELYDPLDPELVAARERAQDLCRTLNLTRESEQTERRRILQELFGAGDDSVWMQPPFYCDYGSNIRLGKRVFFNSGTTRYSGRERRSLLSWPACISAHAHSSVLVVSSRVTSPKAY